MSNLPDDFLLDSDRRQDLELKLHFDRDLPFRCKVHGVKGFILEAFARVSYSVTFQPGGLLGPFIGICEQRVNTPAQILGQLNSAMPTDSAVTTNIGLGRN